MPLHVTELLTQDLSSEEVVELAACACQACALLARIRNGGPEVVAASRGLVPTGDGSGDAVRRAIEALDDMADKSRHAEEE